jgi:hypothetical protein
MEIKPGSLVWYKYSLVSQRELGLVIELKQYHDEFDNAFQYKILAIDGSLKFVLRDGWQETKIRVIQ